MNRVLIRVIGAPLILAGLALVVYADYHRKTTTAVTVLIACFAAVSFHELCAMARLKGLHPAELLGLATLLISFAIMLEVLRIPFLGVVPLTFIFLCMLLLRPVFMPRAGTPIDSAVTLFAFAYIIMIQHVCAAQSRVSTRGWLYWLLFLVATNKGSDMAAYVVGKSIGKHKLAPAISPNKTWEGSIGGFVAGTLLGFLVLHSWKSGYRQSGEYFIPPGSTGLCIAIAAGVTVAAQLGDLVKSAIKRWAGVKDSGRFLPEFGGALDMVDSFILSSPVAYYAILYSQIQALS